MIQNTKEKELIISKKIKIKAVIVTLILSVVFANVLFAWALPTTEVECAADYFLEYVNTFFPNYKTEQYYFVLLFFINDIIFICYLYYFTIKKENFQFAYKILTLITLKIFSDYIFYQINLYHDKKKIIITTFSLTNHINKTDCSLFNIPVALNYLSLRESLKTENNKLITAFHFLSLIALSSYLLIANMCFTFQLIFAVVIVNYFNRLLI